MALEIFQTEVGLMSNFNELVADTAARVCAIVDPAFEVDRLLKEAATRGWRIEAVVVTHTHHDHVDGVEEIVRATGATVYVGAGEADALARAAPSAKLTPLRGGETIAVGGLRIEALATPGHTIAGTSYVAEGNVFTGDTLFIGGCGRTDFPGGDAPTLWRSLQRLASLPERRASGPDTTMARRRRRPSAGSERPIPTCYARTRLNSLRYVPARMRRGPPGNPSKGYGSAKARTAAVSAGSITALRRGSSRTSRPITSIAGRSVRRSCRSRRAPELPGSSCVYWRNGY